MPPKAVLRYTGAVQVAVATKGLDGSQFSSTKQIIMEQWNHGSVAFPQPISARAKKPRSASLLGGVWVRKSVRDEARTQRPHRVANNTKVEFLFLSLCSRVPPDSFFPFARGDSGHPFRNYHSSRSWIHVRQPNWRNCRCCNLPSTAAVPHTHLRPH
jgi:hypothetical protein